MIIFVIVGMPAAGKNIARMYADRRGMPYFATGDLVRAEVDRKGLDPTGENIAEISDQMRGEDGMGVTRHALTAALKTEHRTIFLEGMRSWAEINLIREKSSAIVVAFITPRATRLERLVKRGRSDDSPANFDERDMREISYGTSVPIVLADEYILNTRSMEESIRGMDEIVKKYESEE